MQQENNKPVVAATLTEEEAAPFTAVQHKLNALHAQTKAMIVELQRSLVAQREELMKQHQVEWAAIAKKHGLDPMKAYELVHDTRQIVEHVCETHGIAFAVNLTDALRAAAASQPAPATGTPEKKTVN